MRGCFQFFGIIFGVLFLYYLINDEPQQTYNYESSESPKPDPNREIHHFDWDKYQYVYKDEVPRDSLVVDYSGEPIPYYPDAAVVIINGTTTTGTQLPKPRYILQGGKRYKIIYKANGDQELIEVR